MNHNSSCPFRAQKYKITHTIHTALQSLEGFEHKIAEGTICYMFVMFHYTMPTVAIKNTKVVRNSPVSLGAEVTNKVASPKQWPGIRTEGRQEDGRSFYVVVETNKPD